MGSVHVSELLDPPLILNAETRRDAGPRRCQLSYHQARGSLKLWGHPARHRERVTRDTAEAGRAKPGVESEAPYCAGHCPRECQFASGSLVLVTRRIQMIPRYIVTTLGLWQDSNLVSANCLVQCLLFVISILRYFFGTS